MTAPIEMADFAATLTPPAFFPAATHPDPPIPTGPWAPRTDSDFPHAVADLRQYEQTRTHLKAVA